MNLAGIESGFLSPNISQAFVVVEVVLMATSYLETILLWFPGTVLEMGKNRNKKIV